MIAERHLDVVREVARAFVRRRGLPIDHRELIGYGTEGLLQAIDGFDPSRGIKLVTYASQRVKGAILDGIRNLDWVPRLERRRRGDDCRQMVSLHAVVTGGDERGQQRLDFIPDAGVIRAERARESIDAIKRMCRGLSRQQQLIIRTYYVEGLTMREIGKALDISESRVSQLHDQALRQLRARAAREHDDEDEIEEDDAGRPDPRLN